jgi:hypothetical protein
MHGHNALSTHRRTDCLWNAMLRSSGGGLLFLLTTAYLTGEEYPHTHLMIGYSIGAVILANVYWELVHPHQLQLTGTHAPRISFSAAVRSTVSGDSPAFVAITVLGLVSILASVTFILMVATHLWAIPLVEEMHEALAYFILGLVVLHIAVILIGSADYVERRIAGVLRKS